ncbi:ATP-binding protein [Deinococcus sonorensis]|uniref:AAA family ATPase n=2 Tax=Deinococcus sonorensis TaxID=309891 RepID=A0AAU7U4K7_9DEIO
MSVLELRLLGPPELWVDGTLRPLSTRKAVAMLAYLALRPGPQARETLASLLWTDSDPAVARSALRNALSSLRRALGDASERLVTDHETVQLCLETQDRVDVRQLAGGRPDVLRGPFLEGLALPGSDEFQAWLTLQRELMLAQAERAYDASTRADLATAPAQAADTARRWVALDPLHERAWRRLIQALLNAGQRHAARDALEACRATLQAELGLAPAPETLALERLLVMDAPVVEGPARTADPAALFVGRHRELETLMGAFQRARQGEVEAVMLTGEPGIGKTRLVKALTDRIRGAGARVLQGRALTTSPAAFGVWTDLLRDPQALASLPQLRIEPVWRTQLSRLLPELSHDTPDPAPDVNDALLFEALARTCVQLAGDAPLVLVFDDLHWADRQSLEAAQYVVHRLAQTRTPTLLIGTIRSEALGPAAPLGAWLTRLGRDVPVQHLALTPLSERESEALVAGAAAGADVREVAAWLHEHSLGQPLYLTQALRDLLERGAIDQSGSRWRLHDPEGLGPLPGVRAVIEERCARLPPAALAAAQACVVLGAQATFDRVGLVADLSEEHTLLGTEALLQAGLMLEQAAGDGVRYRPSHDRIRETLEAGLSAGRARLLHRRALQALGSQGPPDLLARHALQAGLPAQARCWLRRHAEAADRQGFVKVSREALEQALSLGPDDTERAELLLLLAEACERQGDLAGQQQAGQEALDIARRLHASSLVVQALNRLAWLCQEDVEAARPLSQEALALSRTLEEPSLLVSSLQGVARSYRQENPQLAMQLQQEAMALLKRLGDPKRLGHGHMNMAYCHEALGQREAALRHLQAAAPAFRQAGHALLESLALGELGVWLLQAGQPGEAGPALQRAVELRERSRPLAPVLRAVWAAALVQTHGAEAGWAVLRPSLSEPATEQFGRFTLFWAAEFLLAGGWPEEAVILTETALAGPALPSELRQFAASRLAQAVAMIPPAVLEHSRETGQRLTVQEGIARLRVLAAEHQPEGRPSKP